MTMSLTVSMILGEALLHVTITRPIYMYIYIFICYQIKILNDFSINIIRMCF
jgi:hypothetical protein